MTAVVVSFRLPRYRTGNFEPCLLITSTSCTTKGGFLAKEAPCCASQETFLRSYNLGTVIIDRVLITLISLFWFIMIRTVVSCLNDCLALGTFLIEAHFAPPHHFKLSFGVTTCTAHPLRALPTTMVRWNGHALKAFANVLRFLLSSICFCRSTASVCSSCKWQHGHEITCTWHKSARMLNKNRRRRWPRHSSFIVMTCNSLW